MKPLLIILFLFPVLLQAQPYNSDTLKPDSWHVKGFMCKPRKDIQPIDTLIYEPGITTNKMVRDKLNETIKYVKLLPIDTTTIYLVRNEYKFQFNKEHHYCTIGSVLGTFLIVNNMNNNTNIQRMNVYLSGMVVSTTIFFIERKIQKRRLFY